MFATGMTRSVIEYLKPNSLEECPSPFLRAIMRMDPRAVTASPRRRSLILSRTPNTVAAQHKPACRRRCKEGKGKPGSVGAHDLLVISRWKNTTPTPRRLSFGSSTPLLPVSFFKLDFGWGKKPALPPTPPQVKPKPQVVL